MSDTPTDVLDAARLNARLASDAYQREQDELRSKAAGAALIRAVLDTPDQQLPPPIREAKARVLASA
jgi:hypothetical protein